MRLYRTWKGQYSTFMKPILIMIFGGLLMSLLMSSLNFNIGVSEDRSQVKFQASPSEDFSAVAECLSVDEGVSGSSFLLNQTKLERMDRNYNLREPGCAENFVNGFEVKVEQDYLRGVEPAETTKAADVVFALDDSGSMGSYLNKVKDNTREFIDALPEGSRVGIFTYATPPGSYISNRVDLTEEVSKVNSELASISINGGSEPEDKAIQYTLNNFDFDDSKRKILIILATEPATSDKATSKHVTEWAEEAANENVEIYTVSDRAGAYVDIAEITEGKRFEVTADYSSVFEEIAGEEKFIGGKSTCTVPPVTQYNGTAQIAVTADASDNFDEEWEALCDKVTSTVDKMEARGLKTNVSYYIPGQPEAPDSGKGNPMQISGGNYDFSDRVPSCVSADENNAATGTHGKGITEWSGEGLTDYNSSKDYGLEAWGVSSKWILENHDWNQSVDRRMLFLLGDQDPTGGNSSGEAFRDKKGTEILDNETEIVHNVTELSANKSVNVYTMSGDMEYSDTDEYGDNDKNDAKELMSRVSLNTGGNSIEYQNTNDIPEKFEEQFSGLSERDSETAATCNNVTYSFGEKKGSEGSNLEASLTSRFPASVRQSDKLTTPASVDITLRKGSLEKLAGAINKAISNGNKFGENVTVYADINNDETLEIESREIERDEKTTYQLQSNGNTEVDIEDDLMIGVNGRTVFQDRDQSPSKIDFSDEDNQFKAYQGASIQVIALNTVAPSLKLPELELSCVNGCGETQTINPDHIQASEGEERYIELGGLGPFYHNFTQVEIGKVEEVEKRTLCYSNSDSCVALRSDNVEDFTLRPGSHEVLVRYSPSEGVSFR
ncbi:hypothetical protein AQV86_02495 [Nanohaloarchaea archaeon SG9]|nr:hypothetical protein AQV86_02495 [Nanohaloarchaea archaeon SG9]